MNDADVSKQIQQMVRFIRQEAEEKANEIAVSAEEVIIQSDRLFSLPSPFIWCWTLCCCFVFLFVCRNSISRSYSWLKLRRRRSARNTSAKRSKLTFARRCKLLSLTFLHPSFIANCLIMLLITSVCIGCFWFCCHVCFNSRFSLFWSSLCCCEEILASGGLRFFTVRTILRFCSCL